MKIIVTCEHGGNSVPPRFSGLFSGRESLLNTHRGYDRGAISAARPLAQMLNAPFFYSDVTRLLIDLNRSPHHRGLFSKISGGLDADEKGYVMEKYYFPYRNKVESCVSASVSKGIRILHLSIHSFAPVMNGKRKNADIGLLYDPSRYPEKALCMQWQKAITGTGRVRVRRNYPYLGRADGLITYLRKRFSAGLYAGVEIELNQKIMRPGRSLHGMLYDTLVSSLPQFPFNT